MGPAGPEPGVCQRRGEKKGLSEGWGGLIYLGRIEVNVILDDFVDICNFKKVMIRFGSRLVKVGVTLLPSLRTASLFPKLHFGFAEKVYPLPNIAESITEGTVAEFVKKQGEWVEQDETVANIETDKVTVEIKSPASGVLTNLFAKTGETVAVGKPLFGIDSDLPKPSGSGAKPAESKPAPKAEEAPKPAETAKPTPAPQAPKPAEVKTQTSQAPSPAPPAPSAPQAPKEAPKPQAPLPPLPTPTVFSGERLETRETMSRLRQRVSQRLKDAQNTYALLTSFQEVDMTEATKTRKELGEDFLKKYNVKLGFMSFFLKATTLALKEYPIVNSVINGNEIIKRNFIDISVAVATPNGLLVPVLRNCQDMKFHDFEIGLGHLANKGKEGKITIEDMQGGTFTVSNGGTFGSLMGTPIINPPQSAILGMHSIINRPVCVGDQILARPMMYVALTYDHRLLDGKDAVLFLKHIKTLVENPKRMLLEI